MRALRKAAHSIAAWVMRRRVERRYPVLVAIRKAEAEARRQHKSTRPFQDAKVAAVNAALRAGLGEKP